jgi:signal transduction histidine kinase
LAIGLNAARLRDLVAAAGEPALRVLAETLDLSEQCLQQVRTLSYLLHPPLLDEMGLPSALRWFAKGFSERSNIDVRVQLIEDSDVPLPREIATALFRVAQEALSNVHRHSGSATALITLHRREGVVRLEIADRGHGLNKPIDARDDVGTIGVGISGMRVRLEQLGGRLDIESGESGTRVVASVPLPQACVEASMTAGDLAPTGTV